MSPCRFSIFRNLFLALTCSVVGWAAEGRLELNRNEVVAFLGAGDVAGAQFTGHLECLMSVQTKGKRAVFRNFGWEGDTVFEQPRDFGFPGLVERVKKVKPTLIFVQYGRGEALEGKRSVEEFRQTYEELLEKLKGPRLVLVTPPPFEKGPEPLPNLALRNDELAGYAKVIREIGKEKSIPVVDLFEALGEGNRSERALTSDGLQLTRRGYALVGKVFAEACGWKETVSKAGEVNEKGEWENSDFESLRQAIISKNRLWFDYSRPQNWAFLGGDRVTQPSSRDHKDPSKRWFPEEMEKFPELIAQKEREIWTMVEGLK